MKNNLFKSKWSIVGLLCLVSIMAYAAIPHKIPVDQMIMGKGSSTADKEIQFNTGDSPNNVSLKVNDTRQGSLNTNQMTLGDGTSSNNSLIFDQGASPNLSFDVDTSQNLDIVGAPSVEFGTGAEADQTLTFDRGGTNPFIRYNTSQGRLTFSSDGVSEKAIGSGGGGGGVNLLQDSNFDFEVGDPPSNWTASTPADLTADTTTQLFGDQSGAWDPDANGDTLDSALINIDRGMLGRVCLAEIVYRWPTGVSGNMKMVVRRFDDSGATELDIATLDLEGDGDGDFTTRSNQFRLRGRHARPG